MSRIGNALLKDKEAPVRRLSSVHEISPADEANHEPQFGIAPEHSFKTKTTFGHNLVIFICIATLGAGVFYYRGYKARKAAGQLAKKNADYAEAIELGVQQFKSKNYDGALLQFKKAYETRKNDPRLLVDLGMAYKAKADLKSAETAYQDAIKTDPSYSVAYNNLAMLNAEQSAWPIAAILLEKAISLDTNQAAPILNLAKVYEKSGQWTLAATLYSKYMNHPNADPGTKVLIQKHMKKIHALSKLEKHQQEKQ